MAEPIDNKAKQPSKTTGFSNIQDIVRANRQNRLGQAVSSGVGGVVGQGQQQLQKSQQQFQQGAQANQLGTAADKSFVQQTIQGAGQGAQAPAKETVDRFAQFRAGQYKGPQEIANKEELRARGEELQGLSEAATGEYGRRGLLQRFVGPDQYSQGQQRMDTLLLGQTGGQALRQARREANLFGRELTDAERAAQAQAKGLTEQARQFGQYVTSQLGGAQTAQEQDLANRVAEETRQATAAREALKAILSKPVQPPSGAITTMPVRGLRPGITQEQLEAARPFLERTGLADDLIMGLDQLIDRPEQIIGEGIIAPTREGIATSEDKARALALAQLAGQAPTLFTEQTQVGGYDPLAFLNKQLYEQKLAEGAGKYGEGTEALRRKGILEQATQKASEGIQMLESDQRLIEQLRNQAAQSGLPTGAENLLGSQYTQQQRDRQQQIWDAANELMRQAGYQGTGAQDDIGFYHQAGDTGQWQRYEAGAMANLLKSITDARNRQTMQAEQAKGTKLTTDFARTALLQRLQDMIGGS